MSICGGLTGGFPRRQRCCFPYALAHQISQPNRRSQGHRCPVQGDQPKARTLQHASTMPWLLNVLDCHQKKHGMKIYEVITVSTILDEWAVDVITFPDLPSTFPGGSPRRQLVTALPCQGSMNSSSVVFRDSLKRRAVAVADRSKLSLANLPLEVGLRD